MASSVLGMDETAGQPSVTAQDPWTAERIRRLSHSRSLDSINGAAPSEKAQAPAMNGACSCRRSTDPLNTNTMA